MRFRLRVVLGLLALTGALVAPSPVQAQGVPPNCVQGTLPNHALSLICVPPSGWNGQLVVYAPGYTPPQLPLGFYQLATPDGVSLPALVQGLGFAFATTSYRRNGLAILEGVADVQELVTAFEQTIGTPTRTHVTGVSEGGLVATLLAERSAVLFDSAFAACSPIGGVRQQLTYVGDFRVLFDYFFPGAIPGSAIAIPAGVIANWNSVYVPLVSATLAAAPSRALELMRVAHAAYDPSDFRTVVATAIGLLTYNVLGANDANARLGGNPFENRVRWYFGSTNDLRLNLLVRRFAAAPAALAALGPYETHGDLAIPLVTLHTTADGIVPFAHELLYGRKVDVVDRGRFVPIPIVRYGHCAFTAAELAFGFVFAASLP